MRRDNEQPPWWEGQAEGASLYKCMKDQLVVGVLVKEPPLSYSFELRRGKENAVWLDRD